MREFIMNRSFPVLFLEISFYKWYYTNIYFYDWREEICIT